MPRYRRFKGVCSVGREVTSVVGNGLVADHSSGAEGPRGGVRSTDIVERGARVVRDLDDARFERVNASLRGGVFVGIACVVPNVSFDTKEEGEAFVALLVDAGVYVECRRREREAACAVDANHGTASL